VEITVPLTAAVEVGTAVGQKLWRSTLWLFNIAMDNGPFIVDFPIKNGDFPWQTVK
jgi:hypothetical protein